MHFSLIYLDSLLQAILAYGSAYLLVDFCRCYHDFINWIMTRMEPNIEGERGVVDYLEVENGHDELA